MREQAVVSAATIAMRDGDAELRTKHQAWAHSVFAQALRTKEDPVHRFRSGLRYNPVAIAFVGMIHALKDRAATEDVRSLLEVATRGRAGCGAWFRRGGAPRLPPSMSDCSVPCCGVPSQHVFGHIANGVSLRKKLQRVSIASGNGSRKPWMPN